MKKYLIMGAGNQAFAMASHLIQNNKIVNIWNINDDLIFDLKNSKKIISKGVIEGEFFINNVSSNIDDVLCKTILITTPAVAHKNLAKVLANKVDSSFTILLSPGRTFGIIEFMEELKKNGCTSIPKVAELQTIIYTCRKDSSTSVEQFALKEKILISSLYDNLDEILNEIPECIRRHVVKANSFIETSLGNVGMVLHCIPVLLNVGWIESDIDFRYYTDGISPTIATLVEELDKERLLVASKLGYNIESVNDWMKRIYNCSGDNLYDIIQNNNCYNEILAPNTINYRYLFEDIPFGLVSMESVAKILNINVKTTSLIIDLANWVLKEDFRKKGRVISNIFDYISVDKNDDRIGRIKYK